MSSRLGGNGSSKRCHGEDSHDEQDCAPCEEKICQKVDVKKILCSLNEIADSQKKCCKVLIENDKTEIELLETISADQKACCEKLLSNDVTQTDLLEAISDKQKECCAALLANDVDQSATLDTIVATLGNCCETTVCGQLKSIDIKTDEIKVVGDCTALIKQKLETLLGLPSLIGNCGEASVCHLLNKIDDTTTASLSLISQCNLGDLCKHVNEIVADLDVLGSVVGDPVANTTLMGLAVELKALALEQKACCKKALVNDEQQTALLLEIKQQQKDCCLGLEEDVKELAAAQKACCDTLTQNDAAQSAVLVGIRDAIGNCCDETVCSRLKSIGVDTAQIAGVSECTQQIKQSLVSLAALPGLIGNCGEASVCQLLHKIDDAASASLGLLSQCSLKELCDSVAGIVTDIETLGSVVGDPVANTTLMGIALELKALLLQSLQKSDALQAAVDAIAAEQTTCFKAIKDEEALQTVCLQTLKENDTRALTLLDGISATLGGCCDEESVCKKLKNISGSTDLINEIKVCVDKLKIDLAALQGLPAQIGVCEGESLCLLTRGIDNKVLDIIDLLEKCDLAKLCHSVEEILEDVEQIVKATGTPAPNTTIAGAIIQVNNTVDAVNANVLSIQSTLKDLQHSIEKCCLDQQKLCDIMSCCAMVSKTADAILAKLSTWDNWFFNFSGKIEVLCSKIDGVAAQVASVNEKVVGIANGLGALATTVNSVAADTKAIDAKVCAIDTKIDHITTQQDQDSVCLAQIKSDLAAFKAKIGAQQSAAAAALNAIQNQLRDLAVQLAECCCKKECCESGGGGCAPAPAVPECPKGCGSSMCGFGLKPSALEVHKNVTRVSHTPEGVRVAFLLTLANTSSSQTFANVQLKDPIGCIGQSPQSNSTVTLFNTEICFVERLQQCQVPQNNYLPTTFQTASWQLNDQFSINPTDPAVPRSINIFNEAGLLSLGPGDTVMFTFAILVKNCGLKCLTNVLTVCGESPEGTGFPQFSICEKIDTSGNGCSDGSCALAKCACK